MKHQLLGGFIMALSLGASLPSGAQQPNRRALPEGVTVQRDLAYVPDGHERQKLDLYLPKQAGKPLPVIVWIHGGAWKAGSKENNPLLAYAGKGYAVASINYRLSQHALFPAQIEDCKSAIRWLRAQAKTYNLDPEKIGVAGSSAGGHLVALLGTAGHVKALEGKTGNLEQSSQVQCVVDLFGPTDFSTMGGAHERADSPEALLIGGAVNENKEKAQRASPLTYLSKNCPPFLVIHGDQDPIVPYSQSTTFVEALKKAGIDATLITVKDGKHGGPGFTTGENEKQIELFFEKHLKNNAPHKKQ
jgi:acetyl esterase/lipase